MLVVEIVALHGAPGEPPTVRLERHAGGRALGFFWSGFGVDRAGDLRMALIEGIARMQGAAVAPSSDGLILHWPVDQCDRAKAVAPPEEPPPADPSAPSSVQ
jgi:hypothetical protein